MFLATSNKPSDADITNYQTIPVLDATTVSNHPLTKLLLNEKLQNIKTNRSFVSSNLSWNVLLKQIDVAHPNILLFPYICQTGLKEVIHVQVQVLIFSCKFIFFVGNSTITNWKISCFTNKTKQSSSLYKMSGQQRICSKG